VNLPSATLAKIIAETARHFIAMVEAASGPLSLRRLLHLSQSRIVSIGAERAAVRVGGSEERLDLLVRRVRRLDRRIGVVEGPDSHRLLLSAVAAEVLGD